MEFTVICPADGKVDVTFEDISTVILREPELVDVVFDCPRCGTQITVSIRLPNLLMSAIESLQEASSEGSCSAPGFLLGGEDVEEEAASVQVTEAVRLAECDSSIDAYCEYFRRQLAGVTCVEDALHEMGLQ